MKIYLSKNHSDEDGPFAEEGKLGILYSSKEEFIELCEFFEHVKKHIKTNDKCHMHFRDVFPKWKKEKHIDIEINIE